MEKKEREIKSSLARKLVTGKYFPRKLVSYDLVRLALADKGAGDPSGLYGYLPDSATPKQVVDLIDDNLDYPHRDYRMVTHLDALPAGLRTGGLVSELHARYDTGERSGQLAYALLVLDMEKTLSKYGKEYGHMPEGLREQQIFRDYTLMGCAHDKPGMSL